MALLTKPLETQVRAWMRKELERADAGSEYFDCGEVVTTKLGENSAAHFTLYRDDADATIPEWVWDAAHEIGVAWTDAHEVDEVCIEVRHEEDCDDEGMVFGDGTMDWGW